MKTVTPSTPITSISGLHVSIFGEDGQARKPGRAWGDIVKAHNHIISNSLLVTRVDSPGLLLQWDEDSEMWVDHKSKVKYKLFEN